MVKCEFSDCIYYNYEYVADYWFCADPERVDGQEELGSCPHYYSVADAKADHKELLRDGEKDD